MKKEEYSIRAATILKIAKEYKVTTRFVLMCVNNERHSATAEKIRKDFKKLFKEAKELLG